MLSQVWPNNFSSFFLYFFCILFSFVLFHSLSISMGFLFLLLSLSFPYGTYYYIYLTFFPSFSFSIYKITS